MNQFQSTKDIKLILMTNLEGSEDCNCGLLVNVAHCWRRSA